MGRYRFGEGRESMPTTLGSLRRLLLTPSLAEVTFGARGFPITPSDATRRLETIPQAVVCGFEWGIDARDQWEVEQRLSLVEPELRGFAYEGATMAFTILDAMPLGPATAPGNCCSGRGNDTSSSPTSASASPWRGCPARCGSGCSRTSTARRTTRP
jgi:hypothetical protein